MGAASSIVNTLLGDIKFSSSTAAVTDGEGVVRDDRRRNSLAFNISRFVNSTGEYTDIVEELRMEQKREKGDKKTKPTKFTQMAENILGGNIRELKNQVIVTFQYINRKYKDFGGNSALHFVCQEGYAEMLEFMENKENRGEFEENELEVDIKNNRGRTPLFLCFTPPTATYTGLKFGVGPDGRPLAEKPETIEVAGDWIRPGGQKARERCIKLLLKNGAKVNRKDFHDFTALHYACIYGWSSTVQLLLTSGANLQATTSVGRTPLMYAVEYEHATLSELLAFNKNCGLNSGDLEGITALMMAIEKSATSETSLRIADKLLLAGSDPNIENHKKKTALHIACKAQNAAAVNLLLDYKCRRIEAALALLEGEAAKVINARVAKEAREAKLKATEEEERRRKEAESEGGLRKKSPWGAWVEYNDKRGGGVFYYNTVTRQSQWEQPPDFTPDRNRATPDATFGMNFYHDK